MSDILELAATTRQDKGKGASRRLRRDNGVPGILYGGGEEPISLTFLHNKVIKALENEAFYSSILTLDINGKKEKAVIKAIQRHLTKPKVNHLDFLRITGKEAITMSVPFHFIGEDVAPGVKAGGIVSHTRTEVEVKCLPANLPEFIEIDVSALELDASIHLTDIKAPKGVEFTALTQGEAHDQTVASIHKPKAAPIEDEAPAEAAEVEAIAGGDKKEGEE